MGTLKDALEDGFSVRNIHYGSDVKLISTKTGDDKGLGIEGGQFSVGSPDSPQESVFGSGDSYPVPIAFHFDYANLSGATITGATNITSILQSDSDSSTGFFGGITSGKALLVGSLYNFGGVKVKYDDTGNVDNVSNVTLEYLQEDTGTPSWVSAPWMVTDSSQTYQISSQYANRIGASGSTSEQIRVGFNPFAIPTSWDAVTLNINGVGYTYKWALIRLTGAITEDPVVQQIKLHTNRFEINANGDTEYFGLSRKPFTISNSLNDWVDTSAAPSDESITYSTNITIARTGNEFIGSAADSIGATFKIPYRIDTSLPVIIDVYWYASSIGSGDVDIDLYYTLISLGDLLDGSISDSVTGQTVTVNNEQYVKRKTTFVISIPTAEVDDTLVLKLERDATAGNASDTYADSMIVENVKVLAYRWK